MAESTLSVDYTVLRRTIGRYLGWDRNPTAWATDETADGDDIIEAALRQFYTAYDWSFMYPVAKLVTDASFTTGTIGITTGTVELTGTTWPSWLIAATATDATISVAGVTYDVATRTDGDTLELVDSSVTGIATGTSYTLGRESYVLPDDFGALYGPFVMRPGTTTYFGPITSVPQSQILQAKQRSEYFNAPSNYAIRPKAYDATDGQRHEVLFWPTPDANYEMTYQYYANPNKLTTSNKYPLGGMAHSETITLSCLSKAEQALNDGVTNGIPDYYANKYRESLATSIVFDRNANTPDSVGYNDDNSDRDNLDEFNVHLLSRNTTEYDNTSL